MLHHGEKLEYRGTKKVCEERRILERWKEATIIPVKKHLKDNNKPKIYRPIALTSHIWKLMCMVNERSTYFLEKSFI